MSCGTVNGNPRICFSIVIFFVFFFISIIRYYYFFSFFYTITFSLTNNRFITFTYFTCLSLFRSFPSFYLTFLLTTRNNDDNNNNFNGIRTNQKPLRNKSSCVYHQKQCWNVSLIFHRFLCECTVTTNIFFLLRSFHFLLYLKFSF